MSKVILVGILFFGFLGLSCSPSHPKKDPKEFNQKKSQAFEINVNFNPLVDILFIVDDSTSMRVYQESLAKNVKVFVDEIRGNQIIDYHIGVTVSDWMSDSAQVGSRGRGILQKKEGEPAFITKLTPKGLEILEERVVVGLKGHGYERFFDPVMRAITPPLMALDGANGEFLRDKASLAVIFITDTDDTRSNLRSDDFYKALLEIKKNDPTKVIAYAAIIPSDIRNPSCSRDSEGEPYSIEKFLQLVSEGLDEVVGSNFFNLCDSDYGEKLAVIGRDLSEKVGSFIPLGQYPVLETVVVTYGSQVIPPGAEKGWVYVPARVALKLSKDVELIEEEGAELNVTFLPAKIKKE